MKPVQTRKTKTMKTNKSSNDCREYNTANADAISMGLLEAVEPNDDILAREKAADEARMKREKREAERLAVLKAIDPSTDGNTVLGVDATIEAVHTSGSRWSSSHHTGWRLIVGNRYGENKKWLVVGTGTTLQITAKQIENALAKIADVREVQQARDAKYNEEKASQQRYQAFIANDANKSLLMAMTNCSFVSSYGTDHFRVGSDGRLYYNGETFTTDQWRSIVALKSEHAKALAALKATFKNA